MSNQAQSPLVRINFEQLNSNPAILSVTENEFCGHVNLRGSTSNSDFLSATEKVLGISLPVKANTLANNDQFTVIWYGPDEWLVLTAPDQSHALVSDMRLALGDTFAAVTDISGGNTILEISGIAARDLLMKGTTIDLHPREFNVGDCAQTVLAHAGMTLYQTSDQPAYRVIIRRSFSDYLGTWLLDAAQEFVAS